jgi:hypothetical protein
MPFSKYDRQTRQLLFEAFEAALVETDGPHFPSVPPAMTVARLTKGLLDAAEAGERDPERLRLAALEALTMGEARRMR